MGDTCSATAALSEESIREVHNVLKSRDFYIGIEGEFVFSASTDNIELVLKSITA
jgi:hypothetical protein